MKKKIILALVVIIAAAFGVYRWKGKKDTGVRYQPVKVTRGDLRLTVTATGVVEPQNRLEIKPPIAGRIDDVLVREGDRLKKGQVLAWMSSSERAALLDAAAAKGPEEVAHWKELYRPTPLMAALSGVLIARNIEPGQTVSGADPVLVMSDRLIVKAQVDETDLGQVRLKARAEIVLDAYPGDTIPGTVDHIAYEAKTVNNVTIYEVDVLPAKAPDTMRSGMTASVTFVLSEKQDALLLPAEAITEKDGAKTVLKPVRSADGQRRPPETLRVETGLSDGKNTEIVSGLEEGDRVLVPGTADMAVSRGNRGGGNPLMPFGGRRNQGNNRGGAARGSGGR